VKLLSWFIGVVDSIKLNMFDIPGDAGHEERCASIFHYFLKLTSSLGRLLEQDCVWLMGTEDNGSEPDPFDFIALFNYK
jgi:hypothetical protein